MKRGPKPKPTKLKVLEGNRGHRPIPKDEPEFEISDDMPEPPSFLEAYAVEEWNRCGPELYSNGLLTIPDVGAFAAYCMCYARWRTAEEAIQRQRANDDKTKHSGLIQVTKGGNVIQNPLVGIANKARFDMLRAAAEFGLTPSARANLAGSKRGDQDPLEKKYFAA